jgi:phage tail sheath gpL-like
VNACAAPLEGRRQQLVAACVDTLANAVTLATGVNAARCQIGWHYNGYDTTGQIAASIAARRSLEESIDPAAPFSANHGSLLGRLRPQPVIADRPLMSEVNTALNGGLTPVLPLADGTCAIARGVTSRSQDTSGAPNYAVFDTAKVTAPDFLADQLQTAWPGFVRVNKKLSTDPRFDESPVPNVATAKSIRAWIFEQEKALENDGVIENVDTNFANTTVVITGSPAGRATGRLPCDVPEGNYQLDLTINQVG